MKNIHITFIELNKFTIYEDGVSTSNSIFIDKKYLYKILSKNNLQQKEAVINELMKVKLCKNCVKPRFKLYMDNQFIGIGMKYYKDYQTLYSTLEEEKLDLKIRLKICSKIIKTIKKLNTKGIVYDDLNLYNILIKNSKIKIVDMNGCTIKKLVNPNLYKEVEDYSKFNTVLLVLSYIYRVDFFKIFEKNEYSTAQFLITKLNLDNELNEYINGLFNEKDVGNIYIDQYLNSFKEDAVNEDIKNIKKELKYLDISNTVLGKYRV